MQLGVWPVTFSTMLFIIFGCLMNRSHVEFQLNQEPNYPFWFTPAQFAGRLIISKDLKHIEFFEAYVPTDKALNVG